MWAAKYCLWVSNAKPKSNSLWHFNGNPVLKIDSALYTAVWISEHCKLDISKTRPSTRVKWKIRSRRFFLSKLVIDTSDRTEKVSIGVYPKNLLFFFVNILFNRRQGCHHLIIFKSLFSSKLEDKNVRNNKLVSPEIFQI